MEQFLRLPMATPCRSTFSRFHDGRFHFLIFSSLTLIIAWSNLYLMCRHSDEFCIPCLYPPPHYRAHDFECPLSLIIRHPRRSPLIPLYPSPRSYSRPTHGSYFSVVLFSEVLRPQSFRSLSSSLPPNQVVKRGLRA